MSRRYKNANTHSGVTHYAIGLDRITVWMAGVARPCTYSYASTSAFHVDAMKRLAAQGQGLNTYIKHQLKKRYTY